jgi:hypothetical protein
MITRLMGRALIAVPMATQAVVRGIEAATTVVGALVLVTSLVPVFAVCMTALEAREAGRGRLSRLREDGRESG